MSHAPTGHNLMRGDIVRYGHGSTALVQLCEPHAGGWHGYQCMGGITFVSKRLFEPFERASVEDLRTWRENARFRERIWNEFKAGLYSDAHEIAAQAIDTACEEIWAGLRLFGNPGVDNFRFVTP